MAMHVSLQLSLPLIMAKPPFPRLNLPPPNPHVQRLRPAPNPHVPPQVPPRLLPLRVSVQSVIIEEDEERSRKNGKPAAGSGALRSEEEDEDEDKDNVFSASAGLQRESLPKHVAVIMDGNRRWARIRNLPVDSGYEAGLRSLRVIVELCCKLGIEVLTVFAFSTDNWLRPKEEIEFLMSLFERGVKKEQGSFLRENIQISVIGDKSKLPSSVQELVANVEESTKNNSRLQLVVAVSYSGQYDIVQACRKIAQKVKDGVVAPDNVNESLIEEELETNCTQFPYPDLLIRTSGELRISNFFLWQLAYTELFFAQSLWPDFGESEFLEALRAFQCRQRRFGRKSIE